MVYRVALAALTLLWGSAWGCAEGSPFSGGYSEPNGASGGGGSGGGTLNSVEASVGGIGGAPSQLTTSQGGATASTVTSGVTAGVTSSSGGQNTQCDPEFPAPGCGASSHCFPTVSGVPQCVPPVGLGSAYALCNTSAECADVFECVQDGFDACCLRWCNDSLDCNSFETCTPLTPSVYVGAQEYGVCWDGLPCVL